MIVTATPNPAVDITISVDNFHLGQTHAVSTAKRRIGGKAVNVARVLAQQALPVTAVLLGGRTESESIAADLPGVVVRTTDADAPLRSTYTVVESESGRATPLNEVGARRSASEWALFVGEVAQAALGASCVVVSGSLPPGSSEEQIGTLVADARAAGSPVIADLVGPALLAAADSGADYVKPNREELQRTVGFDDPVRGAHELQARGAGTVVVSLGEDGLVVVPVGAQPVHAQLDATLRGNPTGAGDAAVASIAARLERGEPMGPAAIATDAVVWSAAAVLSPLAGSLGSSADRLESQNDGDVATTLAELTARVRLNTAPDA